MTQPRTPLLARLNWYWIFQSTCWSVVVLLNIAYSSRQSPSQALVAVYGWAGVSGLLLSHGWRGMLKRRIGLGQRVNWKQLAPAVLLLSVLQTASVTLAYQLFQPFGPVKGVSWLPSALAYWLLTYSAWNVFYMSIMALRRANRFEAEALRLEIYAKDTELRALQAQVNPHFFFNSMNSVRALIYEDQDAAARMIDQLASVMRYALQSGQADTVPLAAELEAVQAYLEIEKIRFEERMQVSVQVDLGLEQVRIPPMSLQTLVENAVKYGVEASPTGSEIRIRASRYEDTISIEIANLGAILPFANSTKIGLVNTRKRLALALGSGANLDLTENSGWVCATMTLPAVA